MTAETPKTAVVPVEPSSEMLSAGLAKLIHGGAHLGLKNAYRAMLAAAPEALANRDPQAGEAWRPIETAPKDGQRVIGYLNPAASSRGRGYIETGCFGTWQGVGRVWLRSDGKDWAAPEVVTLWMPLPASPQDGRMGVEAPKAEGAPGPRNPPRTPPVVFG